MPNAAEAPHSAKEAENHEDLRLRWLPITLHAIETGQYGLKINLTTVNF
jgi:hypothetical protein